jgi:acetylornithine deacetylase
VDQGDTLAAQTLALTEQLVAIDSVNPALDDAHAGETEIARFVVDWCTARGIETQWIEPVVARPSVIARVRGRGAGRALMLNAHLDTVGVTGMAQPFTPTRANGFLHGRGACDMKASMAVCLITLARAAREPFAGDLLLTAVSDEEHGSIGTSSVLDHVRADAAIVTEPTGMRICTAHRGFVLFDVTLTGKAAHTSQPERGANAVLALGHALAAVENEHARLLAGPQHPLLGHASLLATRVRGGDELFTVPAHAAFTLERRTLPGEPLDVIGRGLRALVDTAAASVPGVVATLQRSLHRDAFETSAEASIVRHLARATGDASCVGAPYWMDSGLIAARGIPTAIFGPTPHGLHSADERVDIAEIGTLCDVLWETAQSYCNEDL